MFGYVYLALLLTALAYVLICGGRDERLIVSGILANSLVTAIVQPEGGTEFAKLSLLLLANESWLTALSLIIAFRSNRFWPLPVASLGVAAFLSLLAPLFGRNLVSYGMGVAQGLWAYPQLIILVLAVIRARNRGRAPSLPSF